MSITIANLEPLTFGRALFETEYDVRRLQAQGADDDFQAALRNLESGRTILGRQQAQLSGPVAAAVLSLRASVDALEAALQGEDGEDEPGDGVLVDPPPGASARRPAPPLRRSEAPREFSRSAGRFTADGAGWRPWSAHSAVRR